MRDLTIHTPQLSLQSRLKDLLTQQVQILAESPLMLVPMQQLPLLEGVQPKRLDPTLRAALTVIGP